MVGSELWESKFDGFLCLIKEYILQMYRKYENINYVIVTQGLVYNSILSLNLGRGMVSSVRMVSLVEIVTLVRRASFVRMVGLVRVVKCI